VIDGFVHAKNRHPEKFIELDNFIGFSVCPIELVVKLGFRRFKTEGTHQRTHIFIGDPAIAVFVSAIECLTKFGNPTDAVAPMVFQESMSLADVMMGKLVASSDPLAA
jgi:hypothetical protein